jgi:hypothetical protein
MSQLFFTKAAALRVLQAQGIAAKQVETLRVYKGAVQVTYRTKNGRCSTFLSKTAFYSDFISFRQEGAKTCTVKRWGAGSYQCRYDVFSAKGEKIYVVELTAGLAMCGCPDYEEQRKQLGKAKVGCKHVLATLNHVGGYSSLAEYMDAMERKARADLFGDEPQPVAPTQNAIATLQAAVATPSSPRKTKPAPDPFGGFGSK